jgi:hypothetical protein
VHEDTPPIGPAGWFQDDWGRRRWWDGEQWNDAAAPQKVERVPHIPGRMSGFFCGVAGVACVLVLPPWVSVPLGVIGLVQSARALRRARAGMPGHGLAVAGLVCSIVATVLGAAIFAAVNIAFSRD